MVIRDLTLRSAASFGSFHLIRLLYDEYMFYLVEHRVAQATGETPIGVMGEVQRRQFSITRSDPVRQNATHWRQCSSHYVSVFSLMASTACPSPTSIKVHV